MLFFMYFIFLLIYFYAFITTYMGRALETKNKKWSFSVEDYYISIFAWNYLPQNNYNDWHKHPTLLQHNLLKIYIGQFVCTIQIYTYSR